MRQFIQSVVSCILVLCVFAVSQPLTMLSSAQADPYHIISFEEGDVSYASADGSNTEVAYHPGAKALSVGSLFRGRNANKLMLSNLQNLEIPADEYPVIALRIKLSSASMQFGKVYWRTQSKADSGTSGFWVSHTSVTAAYEPTTDWQLLLVNLNVPGAQYVSDQYLQLMFAFQSETVDCDPQTVLVSSVGFFANAQDAREYYREASISKRVFTFTKESDISKAKVDGTNTVLSYDSGQKAMRVDEKDINTGNPSKIMFDNIADGFDFDKYPIVALHIKLGAPNVPAGIVGVRTDGWAALGSPHWCSNTNIRMTYAATTNWQWVYFDARALKTGANVPYLTGDWDKVLISLQHTVTSPTEKTPVWVDAVGLFESVAEAQSVMSGYQLNENNMYVLQNSPKATHIIADAYPLNTTISYDSAMNAMKVVENTAGEANPSKIVLEKIADGYDFAAYPIIGMHIKLGAANVTGGVLAIGTKGWTAARQAGHVGSGFCSNANVKLSYAPTTDWQWVFFDARVLWNYGTNSSYLTGDWTQLILSLQNASANAEPTPIWIDAIGVFPSNEAAKKAMMVRNLNKNANDEYIVTDASEVQGALTITPDIAAPGQRVTVKVNEGYTLKGVPRYQYNGTSYPLYRRVGSLVNDDQQTGENDETNSDTFFFTMPQGDVQITATFLTDIHRPVTNTSAGSTYLSVFGASYRAASGSIPSGLQFGSRIVRQFDHNGKTYTLQSCGTILMRNDNLSSELASRPKGTTLWSDWLKVSGSNVAYAIVPSTMLLDRCPAHVDITARLQNFNTPELQNARYVAVAYGRYIDDTGHVLVLESAASSPRSYNEVEAALNS